MNEREKIEFRIAMLEASIESIEANMDSHYLEDNINILFEEIYDIISHLEKMQTTLHSFYFKFKTKRHLHKLALDLVFKNR